MKRNTLILLLLFAMIAAVLLSGCLEQKTDKELFLELNKKAAKAPDGKYAYDMTFGLGQTQGAGTMGPLGSLSSLSMSTTLYRLKKDTKTVISMSVMGITMNAAIFEKGGKTIVCSESPLGGIAGASAGALSCQEPAEGSSLSTYKMFEPKMKIDMAKIKKFSIKLLGEKEYADRPCHNFSMDVNGKDLLESPFFGFGTVLTGSSSSSAVLEALKGMKLHYEICMDKEYGFASHIALTALKYSEILGTESKALEMEMTLKEFSKNISESDLRIPLDFQLNDAECASDSVSFDLSAFNDISAGQLNVSVKPAYGTAFDEQTKQADIPSIEAGQTESVSITGLEDLSGSATIEACRGDKCSSTSCYVEKNKATMTICNDSEIGNNSEKLGTVVVNYADGRTSIKSDACSDDNTLVEYFCSGNDIDSETVQCENGCADGACK